MSKNQIDKLFLYAYETAYAALCKEYPFHEKQTLRDTARAWAKTAMTELGYVP